MKFALTIDCITADKPTANGKVYSKQCLQNICDQANTGCRFITMGSLPEYLPFPPIHSALAVVNKCEINENNNISMESTTLKDHLDLDLLPMLKWFTITPNLIGTINPDGTFSENSKLLYFSIVPRNPAEPVKEKDANIE